MFVTFFVCRNMAELNGDDPWLPELRMRPLWMTTMRRPLAALNSAMINLNSVMINRILNFFVGVGDEVVEEIGTLGPRARLRVLILD